jgi:carbonic anhydrase
MVDSQQDETRRKFLALGVGGAAAALLGAPRRVLAQTQLTPAAAMAELLAGNKRFTEGRRTAPDQVLALLREHALQKQEPFAAVLSCADSRVPVEIVFDQSIGHLFVTRVAGNFVTPEIIASLEYGAAVLGTKAILVLGHTDCGAVKAAIQGNEVPGQISTLFQHIQPAVDQAGSNLEAAIKLNAKIQSDLLRKASTVLSGLVRAKKLRIAAGYYDIAGGSVTLLN